MKYRTYPEYKVSEVEWLGKVPKHWVTWKVTHGFSKIGSGTTPKSDNSIYYGGDIPWVTTSELRELPVYDTKIKIKKEALEDYSTLKLYKQGALIIAMYGATIGRLGVLEVDATVNQACCVFSEPEQFDIKFFFYWLWMRRPILISLSVEATRGRFSLADLKGIRFTIPPLREQKIIVKHIYSQLDVKDRISKKIGEAIEKLEEYRSAIITEAVTRKIDINKIKMPIAKDTA